MTLTAAEADAALTALAAILAGEAEEYPTKREYAAAERAYTKLRNMELP